MLRLEHEFRSILNIYECLRLQQRAHKHVLNSVLLSWILYQWHLTIVPVLPLCILESHPETGILLVLALLSQHCLIHELELLLIRLPLQERILCHHSPHRSLLTVNLLLRLCITLQQTRTRLSAILSMRAQLGRN